MTVRAGTLLAAVLACLPVGCGTIVNLTRPPSAPLYHCFGIPIACERFGGVQGSAAAGYLSLNPPLTLAGLWILAVDVPLSLVGDLLTLPIVDARKRGEPWATSWGQQEKKEAVIRVDELQMPPDAPPASTDPAPESKDSR